MIDAIYTSKLYRASKRKSAIVAAANNPINTELVTQLADALSPVYKNEEYLVDKEAEAAKAEARKEREAEERAKSDSSAEDSNSTPTSKSSHKPSHLADSFRKAAKHEAEAQEAAMPATEEPEEPADVENSTSAEGTPITAARLLVTDMKQVVDQIKSLLNLQDTTTGVNRILVKDSELWIYYNDSINLNNVMADAIEALNAAGYTYLEFNRLARSDNAMVFQILFKDTDTDIKPVEMEESDEKNN